MRVPSFLAQQHVPFDTLVHQPAFTATRRARFLHVPGKHLAKCVLLASVPGNILGIVPATHQVCLEAVAGYLGWPVRLARSEEVAEVFRDCEWGGLVPFGSLYNLPTLLDDSFDSESVLVFEAHQHAVAIRMRCKDFERLEKPRRLPFATRA